MTNNKLGQWLKEKCQEEHLSMRQAGEKIGISHFTVLTIIKGGNPSPKTVVKLAHAFGGDSNEEAALELQLLALAGYRTRGPEISQTLGELLDIVKDFSTQQLKVVIDFAKFLADIA